MKLSEGHTVISQKNTFEIITVTMYTTRTKLDVSIRWTGLGTGLWDWTVGLDSEKVALID